MHMPETEKVAPRFEDAQLREALHNLAHSPVFLHTEAGAALMRQFERYLSPGMLATAKTMGLGRSWISTSEVAHTVILELCAQNGEAARRIAQSAHDPWSYLTACATRWVRALWGTRAVPLDLLEIASPHDEAELGALTSIQDVVRLSHLHLAPLTEARLRAQLLPLLQWLALNPPQRLSHEHDDREEAASRFPEFTMEQIAAVANIAWGSRPKRRATSLMAAFLEDPDFRPYTSPSHARALLNYRRAMRARARLSRYSMPQTREAA